LTAPVTRLRLSAVRDLLQQRWDDACRAKGYPPRKGMETRYLADGWVYYLLPGYGRVQFDERLGWIAVLAVQGFKEELYKYVKLDATGVA